MRTLLLLRHAKSSWDHPNLSDPQRPLAPRGRRAAPLMGAFMVREGYVPDLVLCSTAVRATQTWELVQDQLEDRPEVHFREDLYHGTPASVLELLRNVPDGFGTVLLVGHNPTWEDLALHLVLDGREAAMGQLHRKYPTGALAVIVFDGEGWSEVGPGQGFLQEFVRPKALKL